MNNLFLILLVISITSRAQEHNDCCDKLTQPMSVTELGKEFQKLKKWRKTDCCQSYESRLGEVLQRLHDSLTKSISQMQLENIMGPPDFRKIPDGIFIRLKVGEKAVVYDWRGNDFLYFVFRNKRLRYSKWFHSWE